MQRIRNEISGRLTAVPAAVVLSLGLGACAGEQAPGSNTVASVEQGAVGGGDKVEISGIDADGDGEADDTVTLNSNGRQDSGTTDLLKDANQSTESSPTSNTESGLENPSFILELFGTEGTTSNGESVQQRSYEHVIEQLAAGTYEYDVTLGHWEGIFIEHNPDDVRGIVTVHSNPVFIEVAETGNSFLFSSHEMDASGNSTYMPVGVRIGTFEEEQPGTISVITHPDHYYLGGDGKTVTSNQVTVSNAETDGSPTPIEEIEFRAADGRVFKPTQVTYSADQLDRIVAVAEASGLPVFTHERNQPAGVITSQ